MLRAAQPYNARQTGSRATRRAVSRREFLTRLPQSSPAPFHPASPTTVLGACSEPGGSVTATGVRGAAANGAKDANGEVSSASTKGDAEVAPQQPRACHRSANRQPSLWARPQLIDNPNAFNVAAGEIESHAEAKAVRWLDYAALRFMASLNTGTLLGHHINSLTPDLATPYSALNRVGTMGPAPYNATANCRWWCNITRHPAAGCRGAATCARHKCCPRHRPVVHSRGVHRLNTSERAAASLPDLGTLRRPSLRQAQAFLDAQCVHAHHRRRWHMPRCNQAGRSDRSGCPGRLNLHPVRVVRACTSKKPPPLRPDAAASSR